MSPIQPLQRLNQHPQGITVMLRGSGVGIVSNNGVYGD